MWWAASVVATALLNNGFGQIMAPLLPLGPSYIAHWQLHRRALEEKPLLCNLARGHQQAGDGSNWRTRVICLLDVITDLFCDQLTYRPECCQCAPSISLAKTDSSDRVEAQLFAA